MATESEIFASLGRTRSAVGCLLILVLLQLSAPERVLAEGGDFEGRWMVTLEPPGVAPYIAQLDIERDEGGRLAAFVENGPAPLRIEDTSIELAVDARDRQGYRFVRVLTGTLDGESMQGRVRTEGLLEAAAEFGENGASWRAVRAESLPERDSSQYQRSDFDGIWAPVRGVDVRKYSMQLTERAEQWMEDYDPRLDEPQKRCVSPGLAAVATWMFPFEIIDSQSRNRLTFLYEAFSQMRRVELDGEDPEFYPESSMGYSRGRFVDGELEIVTRHLAARTRDFSGEPVGENASITERYFLTEDGNRLNMVMTLDDPENYLRPPIRRRAWTRNPDAQVYPFECDPDSFFRQLYSEGLMEEYIDRARMRP